MSVFILGFKDSPYCAICGRILHGGGVCPEDPAGRECSSMVEILPREKSTIVAPALLPDEHDRIDRHAGKPCLLCNLPVPRRAYLFQCPAHQNGGWCYSVTSHDENSFEFKNRGFVQQTPESTK